MKTDAETLMDDHNKQMNDLAEKYIGKNVMQRGLSIPDAWSKKQWYVNRIKELMFNAGKACIRQQKCKCHSPKWEYYETMQQELSLLADELGSDLACL